MGRWRILFPLCRRYCPPIAVQVQGFSIGLTVSCIMEPSKVLRHHGETGVCPQNDVVRKTPRVRVFFVPMFTGKVMTMKLFLLTITLGVIYIIANALLDLNKQKYYLKG